jgi:hypothetical protein
VWGWRIELREIRERIDRCLRVLAKILKILESKPKYKLKGGSFMYIVKDDNVDVGYGVEFEVTDAEGIAVPVSDVLVDVVSDNDVVVQITPDADPKSGMVHFGAPGNAAVTVTVSLASGAVVGSFGAQFTVTAGDAAAISGGKITFSGLTEV